MTLGKTMKSILVPTDFSEGLQDVIDYAVLIAKRFEGQLSFLHVIELMVYELDFSFVHTSGSPDLRERMMEALKKIIDPVKNEGIEIEGMVLMGVSSGEIVKFAKARKVDLIVMGTRGRRGKRRSYPRGECSSDSRTREKWKSSDLLSPLWKTI